MATIAAIEALLAAVMQGRLAQVAVRASAPAHAPAVSRQAAVPRQEAAASAHPPAGEGDEGDGVEPVELFDIGCNLLDDMFHGVYHGKAVHSPDIHDILARASKAGVAEILITATTLKESRRAVEFVRAMRPVSPVQLACTVGVHPTRCLEFEEEEEETTIEALLEIARDGQRDRTVAAIGEIGLDFDRTQFCPRPVQEKWFVAQLKLARETGLPLFLHNRNTTGVFVDTLRKHRADAVAGGVVHSFDGTAEELGSLLHLGMHIGINGCSLRTPENLEVACSVPLDRLMLETDAPWCSIKPSHAGFHLVQTQPPAPVVKKERWEPGSCVKARNEPWACVQVLEVLAGLRGESVARVASHARQNAVRLFGSAQWPSSSP